MAKALSHIFSSLRGSIAGVYGSTGLGAQIKLTSRVNKTKPRSPLQLCIQRSTATGSAYWNRCSTSIKAAWDRYGYLHSMTGRNLWLSCYKTHTIYRTAYVPNALPVVNLCLSPSALVEIPFFFRLRDVYHTPPDTVRFWFTNPNGFAVALFISWSRPCNRTLNHYNGWFSPQHFYYRSVGAHITNLLVSLPGFIPGRRYFFRCQVIRSGKALAYIKPVYISVDLVN